MNNINSTQVQSTNDASTVSKFSAVRKNYFKDEFIEHFANKSKTRASLIHLGYYTRAVILNKLIIKFIEFLHRQKITKFQIISCGAGFDTTYWRLTQANLLNNNSFFIEIDFPSVIIKKISLITSSQKLKSYMGEESNEKKFQRINQMNSNYFLLEADLSNVILIEKLFSEIQIDFSAPTLFLSECVITYMKEKDSSKLIKWMAEKFHNVGFINYEQIHPDDGFGQIMLRHFEKLQSPLFSVSKYPDCKSHNHRCRNLGFQNSCAISEWDALVALTTREERRTAFSLELFDEFEEFHSKCLHYVVSIAGNRVGSDWMDSLPIPAFDSESLDLRKQIRCERSYSEFLPLYRHSSCSSRGRIFLFGGCDLKSRSSNVCRIENNNPNHVDLVEVSTYSPVQLDMVHGCVTYFEINKKHYFCLYGGRKSPNEICNKGSAVIFEEINDQLQLRLITSQGNPIPRFRASLVSLRHSSDEIHCWLFGGKTILNVSLSDLWRLSIKLEDELIYSWKKYESEEGNRPCRRMSHSSVACHATEAIFVIGGIDPETSLVFNDIWKWCCRSESWEQVDVVGGLLPRYAHTSHLVGDCIFLIGGVNTSAGRQPGVGVIDLKSSTVIEYVIEVSPDPVLLFNHTSEVVGNEIFVLGGGGNCFSFGTHLNCSVFSISNRNCIFFSRKILRKILGPIKENNEYRRRHNSELYECAPKITDVIRRGRIAFYGHLARTNPDRLTNWILTYFLDKKTKGEWFMELEKDLEEIGISQQDLRENLRKKL